MLNMAVGCHCLRMSSPRLARGRHSQLDAVYVVTIATHQRQPLFVAPALAGLVSNPLYQSDREGATQTHAWVLMPDHLHWLFALQTGNLADVMRRLKSRSARAINAARATTGPVWQAGYYDHHVRDDEDLSAQAHYLIANPVRERPGGQPAPLPALGMPLDPQPIPDSPAVERSLLRSTHCRVRWESSGASPALRKASPVSGRRGVFFTPAKKNKNNLAGLRRNRRLDE